MAFLGIKYKGIQVSTNLGQYGITTPQSTSAPLLLDTYSGASAAYSVRRLSSTYTGAALRVRRSSDNSEQDISFVGQDLDTASMLTFCGIGDGFVVTWYDQSGNSKNITQSSASAQRKIVSSGSLITSNSKPSAQNTATSTEYSSSGRLYDLTTPNLWMFSVQEIVDGGTTGYLFGSNGLSDKGFLVLSSGSTEILQIATIRSGGTKSNVFGTSGNLLGQKILSITANRTNRFGWINGNLQSGVSTDNDSDFTTYTNNTVWGSLNSTARSVVGFAQEFILFDNDLTSLRSDIETNINNYYSVF